MKISQVITTYNRGKLLRNNFLRLQELTVPDEIIVVDDGGTDETKDVCNEFPDLPIRYIYNNNPGPSICSLARNIGFKQATHDYIVTCEPELIYLTDAIAQFIDLQPRFPSDIISSGKVYFAPPQWNGKLTGLEKAGDYTPPKGSQHAIGWVAPYTALWNKEWVLELGGWDETFPGHWGWDDIDLLTRLRINHHGQHIALGVQAVHQFHGLGGDKDFVNEAHFRAKSFNNTVTGDETKFTEEDKIDLVANRGLDWGRIRE
jgi:glycosyltransferase involved in cell wall biosynthesis